MKKRLSRLFWTTVAAAFLAVGLSAIVAVVLALSNDRIVAVKSKGNAGRPDIIISKVEQPTMFWGNVVLQLFTGGIGASVGAYGLIQLYRRKPNQSPEPTAPSGRGSS